MATLNPSDVPSRAGIAALVQLKAAGSIQVGPALIQWGRLNVAMTAATTGSASVSFPVAFSASPSVVAMAAGASVVIVSASAVSASATTITVRDYNDTALTTTVPVSWVAIGTA